MSATADKYRREGMADAVVHLVAKRVAPMLTVDDWGAALGLRHEELAAAVERYRQRSRPPARSGKQRSRLCPCCGVSLQVGKRFGAHMNAEHPEWVAELYRSDPEEDDGSGL